MEGKRSDLEFFTLEKLVKDEPSKTRKVYLADTNVFILNYLAPYILAADWDSVEVDEEGKKWLQRRKKRGETHDPSPNTVIIPSIVEQELNNLAHRDDDVATLARKALNVLKEIRDKGQIAQHVGRSKVVLRNGAEIIFCRHYEEDFEQRRIYNSDEDDRIAHMFSRFVEANLDSKATFQFVTQDHYANSRCRDYICDLLFQHPDYSQDLNDQGEPLKRRTNFIRDSVDVFTFENIHDEHVPTGVRPYDLTPEEYALFANDAVSITTNEERPVPMYDDEYVHNEFLKLTVCGKIFYRIIKED
ncbi:MAG TPA: PIN domain-containing protein, partial [Candidatus Hodarchaeales archaeon]|nr:PIN domain-containing protein [Candidatus Hodarchaeales archaeon]